MKIEIGTLCSMKSNSESEVYTGSGYCKRCERFNGVCSTDKKYISCKR